MQLLSWTHSKVPDPEFLAVNLDSFKFDHRHGNLIPTCQIDVFLNFHWGLKLLYGQFFSPYRAISDQTTEICSNLEDIWTCSPNMHLKTITWHTHTHIWGIRPAMMLTQDASQHLTKVFWYHPLKSVNSEACPLLPQPSALQHTHTDPAATSAPVPTPAKQSSLC